MAITFQIKMENNILVVVSSGFDESLKEVQEYGMAIYQAAIMNKCSRILCDERELEYRLNTLDTFKSAEYISESVPTLARVALVCKPDNINDASFWETVAVNRGLQVRIFTDRDKAEKWISESFTPNRPLSKK